MKFKTIFISPDELVLDSYNPRFIVTPGATQKDIISYLIESEDIINLCKGINSYNGLVIGERIVAYTHNGKYIVGEGNRRTCACKLLLNPSLAPKKFIDKIPKIIKETKSNILKVQVDIVSTREEAMASMGAKHIAGIKTWSPFAKMKYFYDQFNSGKTVKFISDITLTSKQTVIQQIKFYNLIMYAKNIKYFMPLEKEILFNFNNKDIKISIFTKALSLSYKTGIFKDKYISTLLQLEYDPNTYKVTTSIPKTVFDKALYIIAKNSLNPNIKFNTRSNIDELTELKDLLVDFNNNPNKYKDSSVNLSEYKQLELAISNNNNNKSLNSSEKNNVSLDNKNMTLSTSIKTNETKPVQHNQKSHVNINKADTDDDITEEVRPSPKISERPKLPSFFSSLTWSTVDPNIAENSGLISLCIEIQKISQSKHYKTYPISATILARALFEQTLIYFLKKNDTAYNSFIKRNNKKVPPLEKIISFIKNGIDNLIKDDQLKRCFKTFADSTGNKDYFDMVIHNPHLVVADPKILDTIANNGLRGFIHIVLNS